MLAHRLHRRDRAYTFIEVMIVAAVLGIIAALAIPMFGQTQVTKLREAAKLLAADLAFAQVESIAHGDDPRLVVFNQGTGTYFIAPASTPATPITNPTDKQPYSTTFGVSGRARELGGVVIQGFSLNGDNKLGFGIYGQLDQTTDATITLAGGGRTIVITVDAVSGQASVGAVN